MDLGRLEVLVRQLQGRASRRGRHTLTWPGASPESDVASVTHGFSDDAVMVQATPSQRVGAVVIAVWTSASSGGAFLLRARTLDGSSPAAGATATVDWEAGR